METPELQQLISLSLVVGMHTPDDSNYTHLIMRLLVNTKNVSAELSIVFMDVLQTVAEESTESSILVLWKTRIEEEILVHRPCGNNCERLQRQYRCVDGVRLFFFLQILDLPGRIFHAKFDVVVTVWTFVKEIWELLISVTGVHIAGSELHDSDKTILYSLSKVLDCLKSWMSGGALWVAKALDFHLIEYVAKTCFFLRQLVSPSSPYFDVYLSNVELLSTLLTSVNCFKVYRMVAYRIYRELNAARDHLPLQLVLEERSEELALLSICKQLEDEVENSDAVLQRKVLWKKALSHICAWPAMIAISALQMTKLDTLFHALADHEFAFVLVVECRCIAPGAVNDYITRIIKRSVPKSLRSSMVTDSPQAIFPPLEQRYIKNVLQTLLRELMSEVFNIARRKGLNTGSLFVDLDLREPAIGLDVQSQANFLRNSNTTDSVTRRILMESGLSVVCRGRVPVTSTMSTFIGLVDIGKQAQSLL
ncbi:hypothetical protein EV361DRAFT_954438 [Lentinula raphanica]|nr:hypothetical protein EV361DRAFT_954438 [Lentinula raphanica]